MKTPGIGIRNKAVWYAIMMKMMLQDKIILALLILALLLGGIFFVRKKTHLAPVIAPHLTVTNKIAYQVSNSAQPRISKPLVQAIPVKATKKIKSARSLASIEKYDPYQRFQKLRLRPQTITPQRNTNSPIHFNVMQSQRADDNYDNRELSQKFSDLEYQERNEVEFLKLKVGLSEAQIRTMEQKRSDYLTELQLVEFLEQRGSKAAGAKKMALIKSHIQWMSDYLGSENYYEYLNLTAE